MLIDAIELYDFRSYPGARLCPGPGITVIVGRNGQGKTNLLEAIQRLATGRSHRVASDQPLVRAGAVSAVVRVSVRNDDGRQRQLDVQFGEGRTIQLDGQPVRRASDALGVVRAVMFAPEDLAIVRGDPADRRDYLDDLLALRRPAYAAARAEYVNVVRQRNALLRSARSLRGAAREAELETLGAWTRQFIRHAAMLTAARIAGVHALAKPVGDAYRHVADRADDVTLTYRTAAGFEVVADPDGGVPDPDDLAERLTAAVAQTSDEERDRGVTLVGPHRDDLDLRIGALPAKGYASHGETWTLALALKLATVDVVEAVGDRPVVLLDDVFAELDHVRRQRLAEACERWDQVLVTAAVEGDVPLGGARVDVSQHDGVSSLVVRAVT